MLYYGENRYKIPLLQMGYWFVLCCMMVLVGNIYNNDNYRFDFMLWNLFLSVVPVVISTFIYDICYKRGIDILSSKLILFLGLAWLLFFPNSIYLITDFIHLNTQDFIINLPKSEYNSNPNLWWNFTTMMMFAFFGVFAGFISLNMLQQLVKFRISNFASWIFAICVLVLSSFGVYLGRFVRLNSWNVITEPLKLLTEILDCINFTSIAFTTFLSLFLVSVYCILSSFTYIQTSVKPMHIWNQE